MQLAGASICYCCVKLQCIVQLHWYLPPRFSLMTQIVLIGSSEGIIERSVAPSVRSQSSWASVTVALVGFLVTWGIVLFIITLICCLEFYYKLWLYCQCPLSPVIYLHWNLHSQHTLPHQMCKWMCTPCFLDIKLYDSLIGTSSTTLTNGFCSRVDELLDLAQPPA